MFQLSSLSLTIDEHPIGITLNIVSQAISFVAGVGICVLSFFEHRRSVRPSDLLSLYLLLALTGYVVEVAIWTNHEETPVLALLRNLLVLALLLVENLGKESFLRPHYKHLSPEETSGFLGWTFFWWINPILKKGYDSILVGDDLPPVDGELTSKHLRRRILIAWDKRGLSPPYLMQIILGKPLIITSQA